MAIEQTEEVLNLKRKARRRLIGAVALTLAVVVILPMVLDSEPKPNGQDIELRIPAPDQAGEFKQGPVVPEGKEARMSGAETVAAGSAPLAVSAPIAASAVANAAKPAASHAVAQPAKEHVTANHAKEKVTAKAEPVVKKQAEHKASPVMKQQAEHQAKAAPPGLEGYVAQVGAYANADTARQELDKLKKWGFSAYTEKTGDKIRVRVGPFPDRDKAEHARQLLEKHGLQAVVMNAK